ncbi:hypothetical protein GCM10022200_05760 [Microbacterium awajiense]|uniref:Uncharacterized protein n=1 Tax=Microbacterium awajiense TaxID=415214 RepID=A0ABP7A799_9MICO
MSTPEQPTSAPLTRKQMRELRNTGVVPVMTEPETETEQPSAPPAPLPRPAEPVAVPPPPAADSSVDLEAAPRTRRQARQQERIRTASVPVITPEAAAAHAATLTAVQTAEPSVDTDDELTDDVVTDESETVAEPEHRGEIADHEMPTWAPPATEPDETAVAEDSEVDSPARDAEPGEMTAVEQVDEQDARAVVNPLLGAGVLAGDGGRVDLPPSFDELLSHSTSGSSTIPNALIVSQTPDASLGGPVTATGEVLVTGSYSLPDGLASTGHAHGTADGKEVDAVLVDGELPAHSSPTPIAASAAISTVKNSGDMIKPPAPEKGSRLMMTLAITAGVLALALVGVLILAFVTGVF